MAVSEDVLDDVGLDVDVSVAVAERVVDGV